MGSSSSSETRPDNDDPDANHPDNKKLEHEGWDDLRKKKRHSTDCLCLLLIIAVWIAMTIVGFIVTGVFPNDNLQKGNPNRLINAIDINGDICGVSKEVDTLPYGYYLPNFQVVCVSHCPKNNNFEEFICRYEDQDDADDDVATGYQLVADRQCMYQVKTLPFINRCFPDTDVNDAKQDAQDVAEFYNVTSKIKFEYEVPNVGTKWFTDFLGDLIVLQGYIFGFGIGVAVFISFIYLYVLRIPGFLFITIWGGILSVAILLFVGSWLLWDLANEWEEDPQRSGSEVAAMRGFAYTGIVVTILYVCLIIVMRKRVQLALGIIKQAAKALATIPTLIFLPVCQSAGLVIFLVPWVFYVIYLASSGDIQVESKAYEDEDGNDVKYNYKTFEYDRNTRYAFVYMIFCWFWTSEFIIAVGQIIVALSFACWYFTKDKSKVTSRTFLWAMKACARYHLGTAAYGSLVIAIIKTIRAILAYIQRKAKKTGSKILKYIICMIQCLMWCLEKIMKFLNKHAYILTAIYGYSFCRAARKGFFLLLRNILRVAAVNIISSFLLLVGKLVIPITTTFLAYNAIAYGTDSDEISGIVLPCLFIFALSYWIASMFLEIFGMGIETILFCFIADEEMFEPADRFASGELMTTLQKAAQAKAKKIHAEEVAVQQKKEEEALAAKEAANSPVPSNNNPPPPSDAPPPEHQAAQKEVMF